MTNSDSLSIWGLCSARNVHVLNCDVLHGDILIDYCGLRLWLFEQLLDLFLRWFLPWRWCLLVIVILLRCKCVRVAQSAGNRLCKCKLFRFNVILLLWYFLFFNVVVSFHRSVSLKQRWCGHWISLTCSKPSGCWRHHESIVYRFVELRPVLSHLNRSLWSLSHCRICVAVGNQFISLLEGKWVFILQWNAKFVHLEYQVEDSHPLLHL